MSNSDIPEGASNPTVARIQYVHHGLSLMTNTLTSQQSHVDIECLASTTYYILWFFISIALV